MPVRAGKVLVMLDKQFFDIKLSEFVSDLHKNTIAYVNYKLS